MLFNMKQCTIPCTKAITFHAKTKCQEMLINVLTMGHWLTYTPMGIYVIQLPAEVDNDVIMMYMYLLIMATPFFYVTVM